MPFNAFFGHLMRACTDRVWVLVFCVIFHQVRSARRACHQLPEFPHDSVFEPIFQLRGCGRTLMVRAPPSNGRCRASYSTAGSKRSHDPACGHMGGDLGTIRRPHLESGQAEAIPRPDCEQPSRVPAAARQGPTCGNVGGIRAVPQTVKTLGYPAVSRRPG